MNDEAESGRATGAAGSGITAVAAGLGTGSWIRMLVMVVIALLTLFVGYEVVERVWMTDADPSVMQALHLSRGIAAAVLTVIFVLVSLRRWSSDSVAKSDVGSAAPARSTLAEQEYARIVFCSRWFVQMRWVAILVAGIVIFLTVAVGGLLPRIVLIPLSLVVFTLAALNASVWTLGSKGRATKVVLTAQTYVDLVALIVMLHFSGGIENPLYILALFHVIIAGIILTKSQCYSVAGAASLLVALMAFGEWSRILDHYTLEVIPHGHAGDLHASHSAAYAACVVAIFTATLFLTAHFVTRLSTQLREDELRLRESAMRASMERRLLEQALETTSTAVRVRNAESESVWANSQWREWFGDSNEVGGQSQHDLVQGADDLEAGTTRSVEFAMPDPLTKQDRFFRIVTAPILHGDGTIQQVVELAQETTREKQEQEKLMRASQLAVVGEIASHVAHEVNNPIAIVSAKARLLLSNFRDDMPEKVSVDLEKIVELSDRVARIAQGLLSYSRPGSGPRELVHVRDPVLRALDLVREQATKSNVDIETNFDSGIPQVMVNSQELEQVFLNLFVNALHAMPTGGSLRIQANSALGGGADCAPGVEVVVRDSGHGMPPEVRRRVFEPFFTTKAAGQGTGLGLSICFGLVSGVGGDINVTSEPGEGTCFVIWLPTNGTQGGAT